MSMLEKVSQVRRRLWLMSVLTGAARGLLVGGMLAAMFAVWNVAAYFAAVQWQVRLPLVPTAIPLSAIALGCVTGLVIGCVRKVSLFEAALAIDRHYDLQDRVLTALSFQHREGEWFQLAIRDAESRTVDVSARMVAPLVVPRSVPLGAASSALSIAALLLVAVAASGLWPPNEAVAAPTEQHPEILAVSEDLDEEIEELEQLAEEHQFDELKQLAAELREEVAVLREPETDIREALARISQMQAALEGQAQYNAAAVDAELNKLADAMASAPALEGAAAALKAEDYESAAEQMQKVDPSKLDRRTAKAAGDRMKQAGEQMKKSGMGKIGDSACQMGEGMCSGGDGKGQYSDGAKRLSEQLKQHQVRKKVNSMLCRKLDSLNMCKSRCQSCQASAFCMGNGKCQGNSNSDKEGPAKKSNSPSNNGGRGTNGDLFGDRTDLAGNNRQEKLTGMAGDGPSETEKSVSPEGEEVATRGYSESYRDYKKMSEEVLDREAIPLGHRQLIRTYFESIRPAGSD